MKEFYLLDDTISTMNTATLDYYNTNASKLSQKYDAANMDKTHKMLDRYISGAHKVLDIGFGSGRDLLHLKRRGVKGYGVEGSVAFVERLKKEYPSLQEHLFHSILPSLHLPSEYHNFFDVIYSIATWMHLPKEEHFEAILNIKKYIKPGGFFILSYSVSPRENDPRFFENINPEELALLFETFGFTLVESSTNADGLGREEILWQTQVFKYEDNADKGIDQIESILSQDFDGSSCKFVLIGAFSQIASSPLNRFAEFRDGYVYFPIALIVEKWIAAYWKLMDGEKFIPQRSGGEKVKPLAFRKNLQNTIEYYGTKNRTNPFYEFYYDYNQGINSSDEAYSLMGELVNSVIKTIITGPVKYSGSSFDDQSFFVLGEGAKSFSQSSKSLNQKALLEQCTTIGIKHNAYQQLYRYGTWIEDSITLRWARFTENLSLQNNIATTSGEIITLLSRDFITARETNFARKVYDKYKQEHGILKSAWSSTAISEYDVDHVMPYSIYANNDLWNLLPASKKENNTKSDKLITHELIKKQKDQIITYWEYMKAQAHERFDNEIYQSFNIDPLTNRWSDELISAIAQQVEIIAAKRGLKRWSV